MRLKQEQFVPFMVVVAIITMAVIVFSSFNFNRKQHTRFRENIAKSDSLNIMPMGIVGTEDSTRVTDYAGQHVLLVFWASWSDKSTAMLDEIELLQAERDSLAVLAALVKDAEESLANGRRYPNFIYTDGAHLYNHLKVPGFPSYILFDENSEPLTSNIGYEKGVGYDSLKVYLE
ncbi:TlpA family protein disulfide reductase [Gracilimonas mengyeensis]|uniref:Thiol-disulfide isomerase or thioredoxin n=1 Tax=Gracilimonas mengyeensis TaxID=1302730 RepID=A0A521DWF9_9BACT|nr:hypothetical protein [Gracilimonas mengyeensis]SMO75928.1 hypothetical protein SAMN06265219_109167 [Gracilimonas mengyeensis]